MPVEPFDITDDNGVRVRGTAEAARDPNGDYYDPKSPYYVNPRYAERHFESLNLREACIIDPQVLSNGMQDAFSEALKDSVSKSSATTISRTMSTIRSANFTNSALKIPASTSPIERLPLPTGEAARFSAIDDKR